MKIRTRLAVLIAFALLIPSCAMFKTVGRSVNDAARYACEAAFGEQQQELGLSKDDIKKLCKEHERIAPFIDAILSAQRESAAGMTAGDD